MKKNIIANKKIVVRGEEFLLNQKLPTLKDIWFELNSNNELEIVSFIKNKEKILLNHNVFSKVPLLLKSMSRDITTNRERLQLFYYDQNKKVWKSMGIDTNLSDNQLIKKLSSKNIAICRGNVNAWKTYLAQLKIQNFETVQIFYY